MNTPLRTIATDGLLVPTHVINRAVTAWRIAATDEIATENRVTVIADGECAYVTVPNDFCRAATPVTGDWLLIGRDGSVSHRRADVFEAESLPVPRANAGCLAGLPPRVPRFPG
ncbi:hypothetical protein WYO_3679 [Methylobacterium sp. GXF4]|uniref:hypothetical protein n=1 Tax=Methylobacterium sp. GXF4 TaxID=1096546 RepID=UPI0002697CED|nr:hypothetical protein [Methylobacterium sp. GXF4]EIZ83666.1 hypothetical protein WYO_3679 [Methylobacterium sp. GXF4]